METGTDPNPETPEWWFENLSRDLHELSSLSEQKRLWLNDGHDSRNIGSYIEVCCRIFDDLGLTDQLEDGTLETTTSKIFAVSMASLSALIDDVDNRLAPIDLIASQEMVRIREAAKSAFTHLQACRA